MDPGRLHDLSLVHIPCKASVSHNHCRLFALRALVSMHAHLLIKLLGVFGEQEFYAFTKKSSIRGFQKQELDALFDELCRPIKGRLVVGNLYRNARGVEPTGAEIHLRAVEIYGSALSAFVKVVGLEATDLCTKENFTRLVWVFEDSARGIDKKEL